MTDKNLVGNHLQGVGAMFVCECVCLCLPASATILYLAIHFNNKTRIGNFLFYYKLLYFHNNCNMIDPCSLSERIQLFQYVLRLQVTPFFACGQVWPSESHRQSRHAVFVFLRLGSCESLLTFTAVCIQCCTVMRIHCSRQPQVFTVVLHHCCTYTSWLYPFTVTSVLLLST